MKNKKALVLGAGSFIGSHMIKCLKNEGYWVRGVDVKLPEFSKSKADEFIFQDLREPEGVQKILTLDTQARNDVFDEIYQFAANLGGAGYIFTGSNDADIMHNSCLINLNVLYAVVGLNNMLGLNKTRIFYPSLACIYPEQNPLDLSNSSYSEGSAYPASPDSEYGWEKMFSERLYLNYTRNYNIPVRIARYHNIFGPEGIWDGGKERVPAAICRKVGLFLMWVEQLKFGEMESKLGLFYTLMNV